MNPSRHSSYCSRPARVFSTFIVRISSISSIRVSARSTIAIRRIIAHLPPGSWKERNRELPRGGHSASETTLRRIRASSLENLPLALNPAKGGIEFIRIYDNSRSESKPRVALESRRGRIVRLAAEFPQWLQRAPGWTDRDLDRQQKELARGFDPGH